MCMYFAVLNSDFARAGERPTGELRKAYCIDSVTENKVEGQLRPLDFSLRISTQKMYIHL